MFDIFQNTTRPNDDLFFKKNDANDLRLGEIVLSKIEDYPAAEIIILGCPQDEGVRRSGGRTGSALAPDAIRAQFYKLTNFGIEMEIFDAGDTIIQKTLEETHDVHAAIVKEILKSGKTIIVLGGGNDISFADGCAMAEVFGSENWLAFNIDAHFDARADFPRNSGTPYRQLLEETSLKPSNFAEIAWQPQVNSPVYFDYLQKSGVVLLGLEEFQISNFKFQILLNNRLSTVASALPIFCGFDVDSVRASDAPGSSAPSTAGLTAEEFIEMAKLAGENPQTKIIEFSEVNPNFDIDKRTSKLVACAMHAFCRAFSRKQKS